MGKIMKDRLNKWYYLYYYFKKWVTYLR
jgi:hypothetical protein